MKQHNYLPVYTLFILFLLQWQIGGAQLPDFAWKLVLRGENTAWLADMVIDDKGNTYAAVNFTAPIKVPGLEKQNFGYPGHVNGLLIKISPTGKAVWAHPFKSGFDNRINDIALAPGGDLLVTGFGDGVMQFPGLADTLKVGKAKARDYYRYNQGFYAARYSPEGERKWVQYYDSPWGEGVSIAANRQNIVYLSFYYTVSMKQHGMLIDSVAGGNIRYRHCLAQLNGNSGKLEKMRTMQDQASTAGTDMKANLLFDKEDNLLMYGYFSKRIDITATDSLTNDGYYEGSDCYIAKLNPAGKLLWTKRIGGQSAQALTDLCIAADNSVYATGSYGYECVLGDGVNVIQKSKYEWKSGYSLFYLHLLADGEADFIRYEESKGYSSYFNGENLALDDAGNAHLVGYFTDTLRIDGLEATTSQVYTGFYSEWHGDKLKYLGKVGSTVRGRVSTRHIDMNRNTYAIGGVFGSDTATLETRSGKSVTVTGTSFGSVFIVGGRLEPKVTDTTRDITKVDIRHERMELVNAITACVADTLPQPEVWLPLGKINDKAPCGDPVRGMAASLFPNPTTGEVKMRLTGIIGTAQLDIFSATGQLVLSHRLLDAFDGQVVTLNLQNLANGTYILRITHKSFQKGLRVVKSS
jgi:hypothetical protein